MHTLLRHPARPIVLFIAALLSAALLIAPLPGVPPRAAHANARAVVLQEGFDDVATLAGKGWVQQNNSSPLGTSNWYQGELSVFEAQAGADNAYIAANFNSTDNTGVIANWLISPELSLNNGDVLKFWTRTAANSAFPDRLQVRLSTAGNSTHVGSSEHEVGFFGTRLLEINETLQVGGYPEEWTEYTITLSGLSGGEMGRFAFLYYVVDAGSLATNGNFIGIDTVSYESAANPVELVAFDGAATDDTVRLRWETASEIDSAGFNILRGALADGSDRQRLNPQLIAAQGAQGLGAAYTFDDASVPPGTWHYWLQEVSTHGATTLHGPVAVEVRAPTAVTLSGTAAADLTNRPDLSNLVAALLLFTLFALARRRHGAH